MWIGRKKSGSEWCKGKNSWLMLAKVQWPRWFMPLKWIAGNNIKLHFSHHFFHCPFALWFFAFIARRKSKARHQLLKISMDGPGSGLVMAVIKKYENNHIFHWHHIIFCNVNIVALSTMNVEMRRGRRVVESLVALENGASVFTHTFFSILTSFPQWAWSMDASHSTSTNRAIPHSYGK